MYSPECMKTELGRGFPCKMVYLLKSRPITGTAEDDKPQGHTKALPLEYRIRFLGILDELRGHPDYIPFEGPLARFRAIMG